MTTPAVTRIARIGLTVSDMGGARRFYEQALGFRFVEAHSLDGARVAERFGVAAGRAELIRLQLGAEWLELVSFDHPGDPYPVPRAANDPWLQHFAIAVGDMPGAYAALSSRPATPISTDGPQRLPPSTGSVTAYKFRDPEGHPLELSYIPHSPWTDPPRATTSPSLGIDHTGIAVADLDASLAFYVDLLGFKVVARLVNAGPEQDRLDGLPGVVLDIAVLQPAEPGGPHVELLAYRSPPPAARRTRAQANDIAATRLVLEVNALEPIEAMIRQAGAPVLSAAHAGSDCLLTCDPDSHLIELERRSPHR